MHKASSLPCTSRPRSRRNPSVFNQHNWPKTTPSTPVLIASCLKGRICELHLSSTGQLD